MFNSFSSFVLIQQRLYGGGGNLSQLIALIAKIGKVINHQVNNAGIIRALGSTGKTNVQGESVQHLDQFSHDLFIRTLIESGLVFMIGSEEHDTIIPVPQETRGNRVVVIDSLDGSSVIDCDTTIGSIVGIYKQINTDPNDVRNILQPAKNLEAAMIILYGPSTKLIISLGHGVHVFTLNMSLGEFYQDDDGEKVCLPELSGRSTYSFNLANMHKWSENTQVYAKWLMAYRTAEDKSLAFRYIGSLCGDFFRTLMYGGMFMYPGTVETPKGKLRLIYENGIIAHLIIQAGGLATNGTTSILDLPPKELHVRTPFFFGNSELIKKLSAMA